MILLERERAVQNSKGLRGAKPLSDSVIAPGIVVKTRLVCGRSQGLKRVSGEAEFQHAPSRRFGALGWLWFPLLGGLATFPSSIPVGMAPSTSFTGDTCSVHPTQASLYLPGPRDLKHVWLPSPFRQPSPAVTPREATRRSPGPWSERASQPPTTRGRREMSGEGGRLRRGGLKDEGTPRGASRRASRRRLGAAPAAPGPVWLLRHLRLRLPLSVGRLRPNMAPAAAGAAAGRGAASGGWKY